MIGPYLFVLALLLIVSVGVVVIVERRKDRKIAESFNARLDKVLSKE